MKKFISMALALVMTLSLCTFISVPEAKAFDDTTELPQYSQQAIDVIKTIQVMDGVDEATFSPEAKLTRRAAAKIICNMILGPVTAKALPTNENPFPDVPAGNQFTGYIAYCAHEGIINGYSDGTFKPEGPLTGFAFLKMLLGALGYDGSASAEGFVGGNWKVNVAKIALGIGLNNGITSDPEGENLDQGVTREDAAIYAFNTLQADLVEYPSQNSININGVVVSMGSGKATPQTWSNSATQADHINNARDNGAPIVQFAERYFDKLERFPKVREAYDTGDFGRPVVKWNWKGAEVGTYQKDATLVYSGNVAANTVYGDLHDTVGMSSSDDEAEVYFNGRPATRNLNTALPATDVIKISKSNGDDINKNNSIMADKIGDGSMVEVYYNDANNDVTICVISVWAAKIGSIKDATSTKRQRVVLEVGKYDESNAGTNPISAPLGIRDSADKREYELPASQEGAFEEDDIIAYIYSEKNGGDNEIKEILGVLNPVEGTLTRRYSGKSMVVDGETYKYAKNVAFDVAGDEDALSNKSEYILYTDDDGFVMWVEESEFSDEQYALVDRIWLETSDSNVVYDTLVSGKASSENDMSDPTLATNVPYPQLVGGSTSAPRARLLLSNGTTRTVSLNESKAYRTAGATVYITNAVTGGTMVADSIADNFRAGRIVRYSTTSGGDYKLHSVSNANVATSSFTAGSYAVFNNSLNGFGGIQVDSNTKFIVNDNGTYKVYTGIRNVPDIQSTATTDVVGYAYVKNNAAKVIYFTMAGKLTSTSKAVIFLAAPSVSKLVKDEDYVDYYEYNAVVGNEVDVVRVSAWNPSKYDGTPGVDTKLSINCDSYTVSVGSDKKGECILINNTSYDTDDVLTAASFDSNKGIHAYRNQGIKRVSGSTDEIKIGKAELNKFFSDNVRVFYSNLDGEIEEIDVSDIRTDSNDYVYYTEDGGDVTNLFIQEVDEETETSLPTTYSVSTSVPAGYTTDGIPATVASGEVMSFQILLGGVAQTSADVSVVFNYTDTSSATVPLTVTESSGKWSVTVPSDIKSGEAVAIVVTPV